MSLAGPWVIVAIVALCVSMASGCTAAWRLGRAAGRRDGVTLQYEMERISERTRAAVFALRSASFTVDPLARKDGESDRELWLRELQRANDTFMADIDAGRD